MGRARPVRSLSRPSMTVARAPVPVTNGRLIVAAAAFSRRRSTTATVPAFFTPLVESEPASSQRAPARFGSRPQQPSMYSNLTIAYDSTSMFIYLLLGFVLAALVLASSLQRTASTQTAVHECSGVIRPSDRRNTNRSQTMNVLCDRKCTSTVARLNVLHSARCAVDDILCPLAALLLGPLRQRIVGAIT